MQPYSVVSSTLALSIIRIFSSRGALGRSYSSRLYFRKLLHTLGMRRSTSMDRSGLWLTFPPTITNSFGWLYTWPAASTLNMAVDSGIPFVRKHIISVLASDTMRPNAVHTPKHTPSSSSVAWVVARRLKTTSPGLAVRQLLLPAPLSRFFPQSGARKRP